MITNKLVIIILSLVFLSSCSSTKEVNPDYDKYSISLRQEIENKSQEVNYNLLLKTSKELDKIELNSLYDLGFNVVSVIGNIVTGYANETAIANLSNLDYITYIDISKQDAID